MRKIAAKHRDYIRVPPTPVADKGANEIIYTSANVCPGAARDMEEIAAAVREVERHYEERGNDKHAPA